MIVNRFVSTLALTALAFATLPACPRSVNEDGRCASDTDCNDFNFCDPAGVCRCISDDACDASEFCNLAGSCQGKLECFSDDDCRGEGGDAAAICDTRLAIDPADAVTPDDGVQSRSAGQCVTLNSSSQQCLMDSHCPFGFFCQHLGGGGAVCQPGCRDNGDCPLGDPCIDNQCDPTPGACNEVGYCEFGETCDPNGLRCVPHRERDSLCQRCNPTQCFSQDDCADVGGTCELLDPADPFGPSICTVCGSVDVPCLIDTSVDPNQNGGSCTDDSQCTTGGFCTKAQCIDSSQCGGDTCVGGDPGGLFTPPTIGRCATGVCGDFFCGTSTCSANDDSDPCPRGYDCFTLVGITNNTCTQGGGQCQGGRTCSADAPGENNVNGFCSCLDDADCPAGLTCTNPGPGGACVQGNTCGPSSGLLCGDLR